MPDERLEIEIAAKDAASAQLKKVRTEVDGVAKATNQSVPAIKQMGSAFSQVKVAAGMFGLALGGAAVVGAIGDAIGAASDLNETMSKTEVVFGKSAQGMIAWGETASDAMVMSQEAALGAAATFGNMFVGMGIATEEAAGMSQSMVQLAADLASFNNIGTDEALEKIRAGLVGEAEPLRTVGVLLDDATLRQRAFNMGLIESVKKTLPPAVKAQAAYAEILAQTETAQGDVARTSDGLANSQRRANAKLEEASAKWGQLLAGPAAGAAQWAGDAADAMADLAPAVGAVGDAAGAIVVPLAEAAVGIVELGARAAETAAGPFQPYLAALGDFLAMGPEFIDTLEKQEASQADATESGKTLAEALNILTFGFKDAIEPGDSFAESLDKVREKIDGVAESGGSVVDIVNTAIAGLAGSVRTELEGVADDAYDAGFEVPGSFDAGVAEGSDTANAAVVALRKRMESEMDTGAQIARWKGFLTGDELAAGLNSADPRVRAAAEKAKEEAEKQLALLEQGAEDYGYKTFTEWANGAWRAKVQVEAAAKGVAAAAAKYFAAYSPPGPESPLHEIDIWGERTGEAWTTGLVAGVNTALTEIPAALAGVADLVPGATIPGTGGGSGRPGAPGGSSSLPGTGGGSPEAEIARNLGQGLAPNGMTWEEFYWGPGAQNRNISEYGFSGGNLPSATPTVNVVVQGGLVDDATAERIANAVLRPLQRVCRNQNITLAP